MKLKEDSRRRDLNVLGNPLMESQKAGSKICESCGRSFDFRKKWERNWSHIKYCSDECKKNKNKFDFKNEIIALLKLRGPGKTICPSEVLSTELKHDKIMMEHVRRSARLLVMVGVVEITQKGQAVDSDDFRGPIRIRLKI